MTFDTNAVVDAEVDANDTVGAVTTMAQSAKPIYWRLGNLYVSPGNVRSADDVRNIPELAAMIRAQGLLSALQISFELDQDGVPTGRGAVEAGGRRYRALMLLVQQGFATLDDMIECKEVPAGKAKEISLSENVSIQPMHPADEYAAYQALVDEGKSLEVIANTYGVEVIHVKRRLKLANVAPELIALFRKGELTLDHMTSFASCDDNERQLTVWNSLSSWEKNNQRVIKLRLAEDEIAQNDPRVKAIGLQTYLDAGGTLKEDLFSDDGGAPALVDIGLVDMLVGELIQTAVDVVEGEQWAWVRSFTEFDHEERCKYSQLPKQYREATADEEKHRKALEEKRLKLSDELDALNDDDEATYEQCEAKEAEIEAIDAQEAALQESLVDIDGFDKTVSGVVVAITSVGLEIFRGMVERTAVKGSTNVGGVYGGGVEKVKPPKPDIPESLMKNLTAHRTAAVQASMLTNQKVSLAALANTLALSLFDVYVRDSTLNIRISTSASAMTTNSTTVDSFRAGMILSDAKSAWLSTLPKDKDSWFAWFLEQPEQKSVDFIVYASAVSVDLIKSNDKVSVAGVKLSNALEVDMTQWWTATPESYFNLVPKSKLAAIVRETSSEEAADELAKLKKDPAVLHTVKHTDGKNWLPLPLRVQVLSESIAADDDSDIDGDDDGYGEGDD